MCFFLFRQLYLNNAMEWLANCVWSLLTYHNILYFLLNDSWHFFFKYLFIIWFIIIFKYFLVFTNTTYLLVKTNFYEYHTWLGNGCSETKVKCIYEIILCSAVFLNLYFRYFWANENTNTKKTYFKIKIIHY